MTYSTCWNQKLLVSHFIDSFLILCVDTGAGFHDNELFGFLNRNLSCKAGREGGGPPLERQGLLGSQRMPGVIKVGGNSAYLSILD